MTSLRFFQRRLVFWNLSLAVQDETRTSWSDVKIKVLGQILVKELRGVVSLWLPVLNSKSVLPHMPLALRALVTFLMASSMADVIPKMGKLAEFQIEVRSFREWRDNECVILSHDYIINRWILTALNTCGGKQRFDARVMWKMPL